MVMDCPAFEIGILSLPHGSKVNSDFLLHRYNVDLL
jgi:hypothetical protein